MIYETIRVLRNVVEYRLVLILILMEYDLRAQKVLAKSQREKGLNPYSNGI